MAVEEVEVAVEEVEVAAEEVEVAAEEVEVAAEEEEQTPLLPPASDYAEIPRNIHRRKGKGRSLPLPT